MIASIAPLDLADPTTAAEILRVQRSAYRVEAGLIGSDAIPPLHETLAELQACGETFAGASLARGQADGPQDRPPPRLAGFVSWIDDGALLDLHRLAVDPELARRGIGRALVQHALAASRAPRAIVQTGAANAPAVALYRSFGFRHFDDVEVLPGLHVSRFALERGPRP